MEFKGLLIGVSRYSFTDEQTGKLISGTSVHLAVLPADERKDDVTGFVVSKLSAPYDAYGHLSRQASKLKGQMVSIHCTCQLSGSKLKAIPESIEPLKVTQAA